MKLLKTFIILLIVFFSSFKAFPNDSLRVENLEREIPLLKKEIQMLNSTNDKILKVVYFTVGIILTFFVGIGIFNIISNRKLNREKFLVIKDEINTKFSNEKAALVKENQEFKDKTSNFLKSQIDSNLKEVFTKTKTGMNYLQADINRNRITLMELIHFSDDILTHYHVNEYSKIDNLIEILKLEIEICNKDIFMHSSVTDRLKPIEKYVKENAISLNQKERLIKAFNELPERYNSSADLIISSIKVDRISDI